MTEVFDAAPGYAALRGQLLRHKERYSGRMRLFSVGRSVLGRQIHAAGLGEIRGCTLFVGGIGGQERAATLLLLRFFDALMTCMKEGKTLASIDVRRAMEGRAVMVIPCLNPDGMELALYGESAAGALSEAALRISKGICDGWQANARGVDLRCAFDAGWTPRGEPSKAGYAGARPMSEPECRAAVNFCRAFEPRRLFVFSCGPKEVCYRSGEQSPPQSRLMAQVLANCCGARISERTTAGGLKDWFLHTMQRPAFEIAIGEELRDPQLLLDEFAEMMMMALLV